MTALQTILDYLRHEHYPIDPWIAAAELARVDRLWHVRDSAYIVRTQNEYFYAIQQAVKSGELVEVGGKVKVMAKKVIGNQRELF